MVQCSLVTVCLNSEKSISNCLRSVRDQQRVDIEHIIVDGGSTDRTLDLIRLAEHPCSLFSLPRSSIYEALNFGIKKASGHIIGILHSNDILADPQTLAFVIDKFASNPDLDVFFGSVTFTRDLSKREFCRQVDSSKFDVSMLRYGFMPAHTAMFHKLSVFEEIGGYDPKYRSAADFKFCYEMFSFHSFNVCYSSKILSIMSMGGMSSSGAKSLVRTSKEISSILGEFNIAIGLRHHLIRILVKAFDSRWLWFKSRLRKTH